MAVLFVKELFFRRGYVFLQSVPAFLQLIVRINVTSLKAVQDHPCPFQFVPNLKVGIHFRGLTKSLCVNYHKGFLMSWLFQ